MPVFQPLSNLFRAPLSRAALLPLAVVLGAGLTLSACSMGGHGGHGDDDHHATDAEGEGHHGDDHGGEDHHEGMAGRPGEPSEVDRTISVGMSDAMDYTPSRLSVGQGETIRFEVTNDGQLVHEFVLGSTDEVLEHHEMMKRFPGMEHDEPNSVSLEPGASGEVVWQFTEAGELVFACLQPGHYEAGMKGDIVVGAAP